MTLVTLFSRHGCHYCGRALDLLVTKPNITIHLVYLDEQDDYDKARAELIRLIRLPEGERLTVPQVFINQKYIPGGATGLMALNQQGELDKLLAMAEGDDPCEGWPWKKHVIATNNAYDENK